MVIVIQCNECESQNIQRYVGKMTENGHDWFTCEDCSHTFTLQNASYSDY